MITAFAPQKIVFDLIGECILWTVGVKSDVAQRPLSVSYLRTERLVVGFPRIGPGIGVEHEERVGQIEALSLRYFQVAFHQQARTK